MILEEGKGPMIIKQRTIQLIKVGIQLIMRIVIRNRKEIKVEMDKRISKCNFELQKYYLIETALLEKK